MTDSPKARDQRMSGNERARRTATNIMNNQEKYTFSNGNDSYVILAKEHLALLGRCNGLEIREGFLKAAIEDAIQFCTWIGEDSIKLKDTEVATLARRKKVTYLKALEVLGSEAKT
jgi:hypothetical protein